MSMATFIIGIPSKERIDAAKWIVENCKKLGLECPDGIDEILEEEVTIPVNHYTDDCEDIWEVKVADIPDGVEIIQFKNSY